MNFVTVLRINNDIPENFSIIITISNNNVIYDLALFQLEFSTSEIFNNTLL